MSAPVSTPLLSVDGLGFAAGGKKLLDGVSFSVAAGELVAFVGPNGAGKTTTGRLAAGLAGGYSGRIRHAGRDQAAMSQPQRARAVCYVPQAPAATPAFTVHEFVRLARYAHLAPLETRGRADGEAAWAALARAGIAHLADRALPTLSGGERQLVWIAAAVAQAAPLLWLDEPTAFLDPRHAREVMNLVHSLHREDGTAIVFVTHDLNGALGAAERIVAMREGRIVHDGPARGFADPGRLGALYGVRFSVGEESGARGRRIIFPFPAPEPGRLTAVREEAPVAVMDSGVGGLAVLRELRRELPRERFLYLADQAHLPYGRRPLAEVARLTLAAARALRRAGAKALVVACNTASAAALKLLRDEFPDWLIVGMEPAVKPAAQATRTGAVGVIATEATFRGELYESVVERFAGRARVVELPCPELVELVESGALAGERPDAEAVAWLTEKLRPLRAAGVDRLVLGCTHFSWAAPALRRALGGEAELIDPAPAVARQTRRRLEEAEPAAASGDDGDNGGGDGGWSAPPPCRYATTGERQGFARLAAALLGETVHAEKWNWRITENETVLLLDADGDILQ